MRNLKKFLALVLAMMMVFSLMLTVSAADVSEVNDAYTAAAEVLDTLKVIQGDAETGDFRPQDKITRAEFATIVYRLVTGDVEGKDADYYADYADFPDVADDEWYTPYIGFVQGMGYMKGDTEGTFRPGDNVTGFEVEVTLLRALGYGKANEFATAAWQIEASRLCVQKNISTEVNNQNVTLSDSATREVVAQLAYRAMLSYPVVYNPNGTRTEMSTRLGVQSLGIRVTEGVIDYAGRDAVTVYKDGVELITASDRSPVIVFDSKMAAGEAEKALKALGVTKVQQQVTDATSGAVIIPAVVVYLNGNTNNDCTKALQYTGGLTQKINSTPGVFSTSYPNNPTVMTLLTSVNNNRVEVYTNDKNEIDKIIVQNEFSYQLKKSDVVAAKGINDAYVTLKASGDTVKVETDEFKVGDVVVYTYGKNGSTPAVTSYEKATPFTGTFTKIDASRNGTQVYTVGGVAYERVENGNANLSYTELGETDYTYYLGSDGRIVYIDKEEDDEFGTYAQILTAETRKASWPGTGFTFRVQLLQSDGTTKAYPMTVYTKTELAALKKSDGAGGTTDRYSSTYLNNHGASEAAAYYVIISGPTGDYSDDEFVQVTNDAGDDRAEWKATGATAGDLNNTGSKLLEKVYEYSVNSSGYVTLTMVDDTTNTDGGYKDAINGSGKITKNDTNVTLASSGNPKAVINSDTVFILGKPNAAGTAVVAGQYVAVKGSANLGNIVGDIDSSAVLVVETIAGTGGAATRYVVRYVFAPTVVGNTGTNVQEDYFYVNSNDYIGTYVSSTKTEYQYWGTNTSGVQEIITVSERLAAGTVSVFHKTTDGTKLETAGGFSGTVSSIDGNTWLIGTRYVFVNDPSIAVYVDGASVLDVGSTVYGVMNATTNVVIALWVADNPA